MAGIFVDRRPPCTAMNRSRGMLPTRNRRRVGNSLTEEVYRSLCRIPGQHCVSENILARLGKRPIVNGRSSTPASADVSLDRLPESCGLGPYRPPRSIQDERPTESRSPIRYERVLKAVDEADFDLFVSYGRPDDRDGSVTALIEHISGKGHEQILSEPIR